MKKYKSLKQIETDLMIVKVERDLAFERIKLTKKKMVEGWSWVQVLSSLAAYFKR